MTFIDLFAGVGGFRRGMELAGHKCVGFCEFDKYAVASYTAMHLATAEQLEYLKTLPLRARQKEILKDEYRNGEWYASDIRTVDCGSVPRADCWCFGFPCQDISVAGRQRGITEGERSSLFFEVMRLLKGIGKDDRPQYLFIENVKNLFSVGRGFDFFRVLDEVESLGYGIQWQLLNSKNFGVPQNRERVFLVGCLRDGRGREVFPLESPDGENPCNTKVLNSQSQCFRTFDPTGIACTLQGEAGGTGAKTGLYAFGIVDDQGRSKKELELKDTVPTLRSEVHGNLPKVVESCAVLTPMRGEKAQNGRRIKEPDEPMFTLTANDVHGVMINDPDLSDQS